MTRPGGFNEAPRATALLEAPSGPGAQSRTDRQAVAVLALALASFVLLPIIPSIIALCLAPGARRNIAASGGWLTGGRMVAAGVFTAWANIALAFLVFAYPWLIAEGFPGL